MAEQAKDLQYAAVVARAKVHLHAAWEAFRADEALPWATPGDVPKVQTQVWIDALKETLAHHQQIARLRDGVREGGA